MTISTVIIDSIAFYDYPIALNEFQRDLGRVQKIIITELSDISMRSCIVKCCKRGKKQQITGM